MDSSKDNKITLRIATEEDAAQALDIYAPYVINTAITFEWDVPTLDEFRNRIAHTLEKYPFIVAERNGRLIGYTYATPFRSRKAYDWAVETAIYVKEDSRMSGVGRKLYEALEAILKLQGILNINACIAYSDIEDERLTKNSLHFHEHIGYSMVGEFHNCGYKFNTWYSIIWMEKMIGSHTNNAPQPRAFSKLPEDQWRIILESINNLNIRQ